VAAIPGRGVGLGDGRRASEREEKQPFALSGSVHGLLRTPEALGGSGLGTWQERQACRIPKLKEASMQPAYSLPAPGHFCQGQA